MNKIQPLLLYSVALLCGAALLLFSACEIGSGDEVVREVSLNIAGAYRNASGIPSRQTGQRITLISLNQSGDQLNGVDNAGGLWRGSIGRAEGETATVTLQGATSAGQEVTLAGTIIISSTTATLSGTWIEPSLTSTASATATVAAQATPTPITTPTGSPTGSPTAFPTAIITPTPVL